MIKTSIKLLIKLIPGVQQLNLMILQKKLQNQFLRLNETEQSQLAFYSQFIKKGDLVFDVGANVGSRSKLFLNLGAKVVAFEPQPELCEHLTQHLRFHKNFTLMPTGLGANSSVVELRISDAHVLSSMSNRWIESTRKSGRFSSYNWDKSIDVKIDTLDNMLNKFGVPRFVKIDVEGYEYEVLNGLSQPIKTISFEFTSEEKKQAFACLEKLNKIADYKFKLSEGEKMEFNNEEWLPKSEFCEFINAYTEKSKLLWGDIYATIRMKD
tara:strand:+ start:5795 stop:6595 length:801 start_codon:yes stop_codon:yes gene_type:complete